MSGRSRVLGAVLAAALLAPAAAAGPPDGVQAGPKHCLWRVRSATNTVYLLGSIHIMRPDSYPLAVVIESAFASSSVAVFEVDLSAGATAVSALGALAAGALPEGRTLADVVSPTTYRLARERLAEAGYELAEMQRMRPWMVATTVALAELRRAGYSPADGVDQHFQRRAVDRGMRVVGLETVDEQLALFADLTPEEDEAFLVQTLSELATLIPQVDELTAVWRAGRTAEVEVLLAEGFAAFPRLYERLVADRNRGWLPQIEALLAGDQRAFVAVGALHLVGERGVVELLRAKGYQVEQL
jgi:uncharacterized protein YbaP (TraB family)